MAEELGRHAVLQPWVQWLAAKEVNADEWEIRASVPWQVVTRLAGLDLTCRINGHRPLDVNRLMAEVEGILAEYARQPTAAMISTTMAGGTPSA